MQGTTLDGASRSPRWRNDMVAKICLCARRGMPALDAAQRSALVDRVLCGTQLDHDTRARLARILATTVQDWAAHT